MKESKEIGRSWPTLRADGANFIIWRETLGLALVEKFGDLGRFMETQVMATVVAPTRAKIAAMLPEAAEATVEKTLEKSIDRYIQQLESNVKDYSKIIGIMLASLTEKGRDAVKAHEEYEATISNSDPVKMLKLIETTHTLSSSRLSNFQAVWLMKQKMATIEMKTTESIEQFAKRYQAMSTLMVSMAPDDALSGANLARDFLMRLDSRYCNFRAHVLNNENSGVATMPTSVDELRHQANIFLSGFAAPSITEETRTAYAAVARDRPIISCHYCKKRGHVAAECRFLKNKRDTATRPVSSEPAAKRQRIVNDTHIKKDKKAINSYSYFYECPNNSDIDEAIAYHAESEEGERFYLDNMAGVNCCTGKRLLKDVREVDVRIQGVGGPTTCREMGVLPALGDAYVMPRSRVNLLSMKKMEKIARITYVQG
jgi:hypothetical protein